MKRKEFLQTCSFLCLAGLTASGGLQSCTTAYYIPNTQTGNSLIIKRTDFLEHTWVLVRNNRFKEPIYLKKVEGDSFSAVLLHCQHKGCEVNPGTDFLVCPCHGSEYTATGKVVQGPAERDLQKFQVKTDADYIYIQI